MAYSGTVTYSHHGTLSGGTQDVVNFSAARFALGVINRGTVDLYIRTSNMGTAEIEAAEEDNTFCVPVAPAESQSRRVVYQTPVGFTSVRVLPADVGTIEYSVEAYR